MSRSVPTRREIRRQQTIEEILGLAREEMQAHGVAALSLSVVAKRMGMRTPSLYNYFASKDAIYDELFRRGYLEFGDRMEQQWQQGGTLRARIEGALTAYMLFAQQNPDLYQIMFQRPVPGFTPSDESYAVALGVLASSREKTRTVLASGELHFSLPIEQAGDLLIALQHGLTEMHLANDPELPVGQGRYGKLIAAATQFVLDAWAQRPADK